MGKRALIASRSGPLSPWFEDTVELLGYDVRDTFAVEAPEDGQYNLPPSLVDSLKERVRETDTALIAVDELLHPGQAADLRAALSPSAVRDRRGVVWERLAGGGNPVAGACLDLSSARIERRLAERAQRNAADADPSGVSGSVSDLDRRCQRVRERLETARSDQRQRVERGYEGVDTYVVVTGPATTDSSKIRASLSQTESISNALFRPARPVTETVPLGPSEAALTVTPGIAESFPDWYAGAVPGTLAALERAETIVVAGSSTDRIGDLAETIATRFDADGFVAAVPGGTEDIPSSIEEVVDPESLLTELAAGLSTVRVELRLPYVGDAHALVSELHESGGVESVDYGESIRLRATVPEDGLEELRRRVEEFETDSGVEPFRRVDEPDGG
jgi:50S ribosomal subunit-associated GTPase HflX